MFSYPNESALYFTSVYTNIVAKHLVILSAAVYNGFEKLAFWKLSGQQFEVFINQ